MGNGDQQHGFRVDAAGRFGTAYQEANRDRFKRKQRRQLADDQFRVGAQP